MDEPKDKHCCYCVNRDKPAVVCLGCYSYIKYEFDPNWNNGRWVNGKYVEEKSK